MDSESVAAALMHDVAEDTPVTIDEIRQKFGSEVALLVDGVTKLTQIKFSNVEDRKAENLRKMLLAMSQDVRVMIIKLCDRPAQYAYRRCLAGAEHAAIKPWENHGGLCPPLPTALAFPTSRRSWRTAACNTWILWANMIRSLLNKGMGMNSSTISAPPSRNIWNRTASTEQPIRHRVKSIYGIYRKMYMQNKDFEEIYDIYAVRIIIDTVAECYTALGLIHDMYHPLPNRFKDYISTPKPNGYRACTPP